MRLLVILRKVSLKELSPEKGAFSIITTSERFLNENIKKTAQEITLLSLSPDELKVIENDFFEYFINLPNTTLNGSAFPSRFTYKKINYWYFVRFSIYRRLLKEKTADALKEVLIKTIQKKQSDYLYFFLSNEQDRSNFSGFSQAHFVIKKSPLKREKKISFLFLFLLRAFIGSLLLLVVPRKKHGLVLNLTANLPLVDIKTLKVQSGHPDFEYFLTKKSKDFVAVTEVFPDKIDAHQILSKNNFGNCNHGKKLNFEFFIVLSLLNPLTLLNLWKLRKEINKLSELTKNKGHDEAIINQIISHRGLILYTYLRSIAVKYLLYFYHFRSLGVTNEYNPLSIPFVLGAKEKNIFTYGLQHGSIYEKHPGYIYHPTDKEFTTFPNQLFLWGEAWGNILINHSIFHKDQLHIIGQPRTDCIPLLKDINKKKFNNQLSNDKPVILFASQEEKYMDQKINAAFFKLSAHHPEWQFLFRPHPAERNHTYFYKIAKDEKTNNFIVTNDDLYLALAISDIVIVNYSTVGTEAIYFKKDLIVFDYFGKDLLGFTDKKVSLLATNYPDLELTIKSLLENKIEIQTAKKESYINKRAYKIDGKVIERTLSYLNNKTI